MQIPQQLPPLPRRLPSGPVGLNGILNQSSTTGASAATARQDGLKAGVGASRQMAMTDLKRLQPFKDVFESVGASRNLPPALLAAIASRESRAGNALDRNGYGDGGNGFGLMQVDKRYHDLRGSPSSREHVDQAAGVLQGMLTQVRKDHPTWTPDQQLRGAVAAYNTGADDVRSVAGMDAKTTGKDYSSDVWTRAQVLAPYFGGAPSKGPTPGKSPTPAPSPTAFPPFDGRFSASPSLAGVQSGKQTLNIGHQGEAVGQVQDLLMQQGLLTQAQVGQDRGFFGAKTRAAVDAFQQKHGLTPPKGLEGAVGNTTLQWLRNGGRPPAPTPPPAPPRDTFDPPVPVNRAAPDLKTVQAGQATLRQGMQGPAVERLQDLLIQQGYLTEAQKKTGAGTFGPATAAAVSHFQQDRGLKTPSGMEGQVGATTLGALQKPPPAPKPSAGAVMTPDQAFIVQFKDGKYNPTGPDGSANCGPSSLAMSMAYMGKMPPGLTKEQQVDHARALMNPDRTRSFTYVNDSHGNRVPMLDRDGELTSEAEERSGVTKAGGTPQSSSGWNALDQALKNGPVIANGYLNNQWRAQFPERVGSGDIRHIASVLGQTPAGKYIVADPMHTGGPVEMTRQQLSVFFKKTNDGVPQFVATNFGASR